MLSTDGKGIVMRHDALRPATAKKAAGSTNKLQARLSAGEKRDRKRSRTQGALGAGWHPQSCARSRIPAIRVSIEPSATSFLSHLGSARPLSDSLT